MRISDWSSDVCSSYLGSRQAGPHPPVDEGRGRRRGRRGRVSRRDIVVRYGTAGFGPLFLWLFPMQEAKVAATRARRFVCGLRPFIGAVPPGTEETAPMTGRRDRKRTRLNSSHLCASRLPSSSFPKKPYSYHILLRLDTSH